MAAELLLDERHTLDESKFATIRIWRVPRSVRGSRHVYKYSLAYIVNGTCVMRFDNEAGKGDHVHFGGVERPYAFTTAEQLLADFWSCVDEWDRS